MKRWQKMVIPVFLYLTSSVAGAKDGGVVINTTRIIFNEKDSGVAVGVMNTSKTDVYLMKMTISKQNNSRKGDSPFFVSPPLFRLEPGASNSVRINGDTHQLPRDRESLFYFHSTGIPSSNPLSKENSEGFISGGLTFSVSNNIKLFWRPAGLNSSPEEAVKKLSFSRIPMGITARNDSPYYVTLASLKVSGKDVDLNNKTSPRMLAPFSSATWHVTRSGRVEWVGVGDMGNMISASGVIQ